MIDDTKGVTLTQASSKDASLAEEVKGKTPVQVAALVGKLAAERALEKVFLPFLLTVAVIFFTEGLKV